MNLNRLPLILGLMLISLVVGCTMPVSYAPRSMTKLDGSLAVGSFTYKPAEEGRVGPEQLQNTALGGIHLTENIDGFVKNAIAQELDKSGVRILPEAPLRLDGEILELKADDLGFHVDWTCSIRFTLMSQTERWEKICNSSPYRTGKLTTSEVNTPLAVIISSTYEDLVNDPGFRNLVHKQ